MGTIVENLTGTKIFPAPTRQKLALPDSWTGNALTTGPNNPNGLTIITADNGLGNAISRIVMGYGRDNLLYEEPYYNNPAQKGGQTTPVTAWLSPAQDDSWAPRYQVSGQYQVTTQVPPQQTPFMTHIYSVTGTIGIWRVAYVINDNTFVVYDPQQTAVNNFGNLEIIPICQNIFPMTSIIVEGDGSGACTVYDVLGNGGGPVAGPFRLEFTANQEGIVEPFLLEQSGGNIVVTMNY